MNYLVKATPTRQLLALTAAEHDELMVGERAAATALITAGTILWMWRLPDTTTSLTMWDADGEEALDVHLKTLPLYPYHDIEITGLGAHPAFPAALRASSLRRQPGTAATDVVTEAVRARSGRG